MQFNGDVSTPCLASLVRTTYDYFPIEFHGQLLGHLRLLLSRCSLFRLWNGKKDRKGPRFMAIKCRFQPGFTAAVHPFHYLAWV